MCRFQQARLDLLHWPVTVVITDSDRTCRLVRLDCPDRVCEHARDRSGDQACQDPFEGREGSDEVGTLAAFDDCRARLFVCSTSEQCTGYGSIRPTEEVVDPVSECDTGQ
jgi:hypothetical protein